MTAKATRLVGFDVHACQTHAAILHLESGELAVSKLQGPPLEVVGVLERLGAGVVVVYEAGPTGFGLARAGRERGIDVRVVAPGSIQKGSGDRVKTDRRDAIGLVRLLAAGELSFALVPTVEDEQFRDMVRCIDDIRADLMRARHRLGKFLLRRGERYPGPAGAWTTTHMAWLRAVRFADACSQAAFADYLAAVEFLLGRRRTLLETLERQVPESAHAPGDRAATVLPRDRHAVRRRDLRRRRPLRAVPQARPAVRVPRDRALRAHLRHPPTAGIDHQSRATARTPAAGRGCPPPPLPTTRRRQARPPPGRAGSTHHRDRVARAAAPVSALATPPQPATQTHQRGHDRGRPRARRVPLGGRHA